MCAVYNGEADFATVFYSAPAKPEGEPKWAIGDDPDIPADLIDSCAPNEDKSKLMCGDWRVLDARANLREEAPDVVQKVRILGLTDAIPNDTLSFGPNSPLTCAPRLKKPCWPSLRPKPGANPSAARLLRLVGPGKGA